MQDPKTGPGLARGPLSRASPGLNGGPEGSPFPSLPPPPPPPAPQPPQPLPKTNSDNRPGTTGPRPESKEAAHAKKTGFNPVIQDELKSKLEQIRSGVSGTGSRPVNNKPVGGVRRTLSDKIPFDGPFDGPPSSDEDC